MLLSRITPLVLTYNEEANIGRTLERLQWAGRIVVIDSHSTDRTLEILEGNPRVDVFQRTFDHFANQCNYGLEKIDTEWVLSLDADYLLSEAYTEQLRALPEASEIHGYAAPFTYCVFGRPLRGALYPPRTVLYRRKRAKYEQDGHAHRVSVEGETDLLTAPIYHDDRKPLSAWLEAQERYTHAEIAKYAEQSARELPFTDRLRTLKLAPPLVFLYCLLGNGLLLDGKAGWYYTLQRTYAELLLSLRLLDDELRDDADAPR